MKRKTLFALSTVCIFAIAQPCLADIFGSSDKTSASSGVTASDNAATPTSMSAVLKILQQTGYTAVKEIEFDTDKHTYEADVVDAQGKTRTLTIDSQGKITKDTPDAISMLDAVKKVEAAGYHNVTHVNFNLFGNYKIDAQDSSGSSVTVTVDGDTGEIDR